MDAILVKIVDIVSVNKMEKENYKTLREIENDLSNYLEETVGLKNEDGTFKDTLQLLQELGDYFYNK